MALFQKKPQVSSNLPFYTIGLGKTLLIAGLGNPGKKYDGTRHNIGFAIVDNLASKLDFPDWVEKKDLKSLMSQQNIADNRVILIKPTTFMNLSGQAAQAVQNFYKIPLTQVVAVYDELDIPFGQIRTRAGGSSAGHNGAQSLIDHLDADFGRVRVGIHNEIANKADGADFVLGKFTKDEHSQLPALLREATAILSEYIHGQPLTADTRSFIV
jgi:PTH1 family peptidyl-tRNA hydrolase